MPNILFVMKKNHIAIGFTGEDLAASFLKEQGYIILERNWRYKHFEIDIIASYENVLVFIEVKTRSSLAFGYPEESISKIKMNRLKIASSLYHYHHPQFKRIQFNVIAILLEAERPMAIKMFQDVYF